MHLARALAAAAFLAALLATPRARASDARFDALRGGAARLDSLGPFLEKYVGACKDAYARADCEKNVRDTRRALDGKAYAASVAEQTLELVKAERTRSGWRFVVTPFIDGGGLALTHGQPRRQDAAGRPLIDFMVLEGALPAGMDELALESALRTGRLELEVIFRPEGTWKLRRRGEGGFYEGVRARFLALRLVETRSGQEIASRVF
jgi:hypothetical protein